MGRRLQKYSTLKQRVSFAGASSSWAGALSIVIGALALIGCPSVRQLPEMGDASPDRPLDATSGTGGKAGTGGSLVTGTGGSLVTGAGGTLVAGTGGSLGNGTGGVRNGTGGGGTGGGATGGAGTGGAGGAGCTQTGSCGTTCAPGRYDCSTGTPVCMQSAASAGTTCGTGRVCDGNGNCVSCTMGASCGSACNPGTFDCTGAPACTGQKLKAVGASCGTNMVCDSTGSCNACTLSAPCGPICKPGTTSCATGTPVCNANNAPPGTNCGPNLVCNGNGACVSLTANGGTCTTGSECQSGNCSTGGGKSLCCQSGFVSCGTCVNPAADNSNCGGCGTKCGVEQTCTTTGCACKGYTFPASCGGCGTWNWDSGTTDTEGWGAPSGGADNVTVSTSEHHDGSGSLAVHINALVSTDTSGGGSVTLSRLCASSGPLNAAGYTASAWIKFVTSATSPGLYPFITFSGALIDTGPQGVVYNTWFQVTVGTNFQFGSLTNLEISYSVVGGFVGTMYIDSLTLSGP